MMNSKLEKLTISPFAKKGDTYVPLLDIKVLFNPEEYSIKKTVTWSPPEGKTQSKLNAPTISFGGGGSRILSLNLFFDVTLPIRRNGQEIIIEDVREETNKIVALTRIHAGEEQPRICQVSWGAAPQDSDLPFTGTINSLTQKFTQFRSNGSPVRAYLTVDFTEFLDPKLDALTTFSQRLLNTHTILGGESLSNIAAEVYHDTRRWRTIAEANGIDNPRQLTVGRSLTLPKIF
jgi:hypothetical protein